MSAKSKGAGATKGPFGAGATIVPSARVGYKLSTFLDDLVRRDHIKGWEVSHRLDIDALVVRVAFFNNRFQQWAIDNYLLEKAGTAELWIQRITQDIFDEMGGGVTENFRRSASEAFARQMDAGLMNEFNRYGSATTEVKVMRKTTTSDDPKPTPQPSNAYRRDNIDWPEKESK